MEVTVSRKTDKYLVRAGSRYEPEAVFQIHRLRYRWLNVRPQQVSLKDITFPSRVLTLLLFKYKLSCWVVPSEQLC